MFVIQSLQLRRTVLRALSLFPKPALVTSIHTTPTSTNLHPIRVNSSPIKSWVKFQAVSPPDQSFTRFSLLGLRPQGSWGLRRRESFMEA